MATTYVLPQVQVFQELNTAPQAGTSTQPAHISAGHAFLSIYESVDNPTPSVPAPLLDYYNAEEETAYDWPGLPAGAIVDPSYTEVFIKNALLQYFNNGIDGSDTLTTVAGRSNYVTAGTTVWKSNGADYPRAAALLDRDVQLGDIVQAVAVVDDVVYKLWTYVQGFVADQVASEIGAATADAGNYITQSASHSSAQSAGPYNCVKLDSVNAASYNGLPDGDIIETYTIKVVQGSVDGYAPSAVLQVLSASGNDDVANVTPALFGEPTDIGTRGLAVTWGDTLGECSYSSSLNGVSDLDFVVGQTWTVTVHQAFTAPVATAGGAYGGSADATYIVTVTRGGTWIEAPQISVTTNIGTDVSGPTAITASATNFPVGTQGVVVQFSGTALRAGDKYYIPVTAVTNGAYHTLQLGHNFPAAVINNGPTVVGITLYIQQDSLQVPMDRAGFAPIQNWYQTAEQLTLNTDINAYDPSWTDDGVMQPLPVFSNVSTNAGQVYVQYRAWLSDLAAGVFSIYNVSTLDAQISGDNVPDNPLKYFVSKALQNNNGVPVSYTAVVDPNNVDDWQTVLNLVDGRLDCYGLVPCTNNPAVWSLFAGFVNDESTPVIGAWRELWLSLQPIVEQAVDSQTNSQDGNVVLATISEDPDHSGNYTILDVSTANAQYVTNGVLPGDVVRYDFGTDGFGNVTYTEYVVAAVINQDSLRLVAGPGGPVSVAQKVEVWRNLSLDQQIAALGKQNTFSNRRIMLVWPGEVNCDGFTDVPGYALTAAVAALASGVVPQQGLTNVALTGFQSVPLVAQFSRTQLDALAANGIWIVTQHPASGAIYTRDALTTGPYDDINQRSECITRNLDNVSLFEQAWFAPYIGVSNVTPSLLTTLQAEFNAMATQLMSNNTVARLGPQVISLKLTDLRPDATLQDYVLMAQAIELPYALNVLEAYLVL